MAPTAKRKRNYRKEYDEYHAKPKQKKRRAGRNAANSKLKPPKGMEVHHKNGNAQDNRRSNLAVISKTANRRMQPKRKPRRTWDMEIVEVATSIWPIVFGLITLIVILAKLHSDTEILKEKVRTLFDLFNGLKKDK